MMCADFEEDIYLYSELTENEKLRVDQHVRTCVACQQLFQTTSGIQSLVAQTSASKPSPVHHARLTSDIMQAIHQSSQQKRSGLNVLFQHSFFKYAMVATSLVLIGWFGIEQQAYSSTSSVKEIAAIAPPKTVSLNSSSMLKVVFEKIESKQKEPISLYACAKSESCELVKNYKLKKSS